eukprot:scaffold76610_cov42-Phaeocystis_antarctica.AAC.3
MEDAWRRQMLEHLIDVAVGWVREGAVVRAVRVMVRGLWVGRLANPNPTPNTSPTPNPNPNPNQVRDLCGDERKKEDQLAGVQMVPGSGPKQASAMAWPLRWLNRRPPDGKIGTLTISLKHNATPLNAHQERMLSLTGPLLQCQASPCRCCRPDPNPGPDSAPDPNPNPRPNPSPNPNLNLNPNPNP